jgi:uncharacterized protein YciI
MKFTAISSAETTKTAQRPTIQPIGHVSELSSITASCGPPGRYAGDARALWVLDADSAEAAEEIVKGDPLVDSGVITSWRIRPIAYWSAREAKARARSRCLPMPRPPWSQGRA